jgi:hypothetical protein
MRGGGVAVTNPWSGRVETIYWPNNIRSGSFRVWGTVSSVRKGEGWDWAIEIFLGSIWHSSNGDFDRFVQGLFETWLEEFLHMIYRWERVNSDSFLTKEDEFSFVDEEKPVKEWVRLLTEF